MIVTIGGIPVYDAIISDPETGMFKISLVDDPAVMSNFMAFDNARRPQLYAIQDEEKRLVRGCIMRADFPIYRADANGEYYVIYKADQIRLMAEKYLMEGRCNLVNLMHEEGSDVDCVDMVQFFIKGGGVSVEGFDECADGSLFGEFHILSDELWDEIKAGTYRGFSLEGVFDLVPEQDRDEIQEIVDVLDGAFRKIFKHSKDMSKLSRLKETLARMLAEFGNVTTDKGILVWDGDEDIKAGDPVFIEDADGNRTPAEDGDYTTADNKVITVSEGKVTEIKDAEAEVAPEEDAAPEVVEAEGDGGGEGEGDGDGDGEGEGDESAPETTIGDQERKIKELEDRIKELEEENAALKEENAALKDEVAKMQKMSAAKPAHEEVTESVKTSKTGNRHMDNLSRILAAK